MTTVFTPLAHRSLAMRLSCLACLLLAPAFASAELTKADRDLLASVCPGVLHDPEGAEFVVLHMPERRFLAEQPGARFGWLVRGRGYQMDRVYFADGTYRNVWDRRRLTSLDFHGRIKKFLHTPMPEGFIGDWTVEQAEKHLRIKETSFLSGDSSDERLIYPLLAVWSYRLGHVAEAEQLWRVAESAHDKPAEVLRNDIAEACRLEVIHAFGERRDTHALHALARYLTLEKQPPEEMQDLRKELERRQREGRLDTSPYTRLPTAYATWTFAQKVAYLQRTLDDLDMRSDGGDPFWPNTEVVQAWLDLGEAALPALFESIANDRRLVRFYLKDRFGVPVGFYLTAAAPALAITKAILGVYHYPDYPDTKSTTDALQQYWKDNAKRPFDERMMATLTDPKRSPSARLEAAERLVFGRLKYASISRDYGTPLTEPQPLRPNPAMAKFTKPTIAEAMLQAMTEDVAARQREKDPVSWPRTWQEIMYYYLQHLIALGDKRVAPTLERMATKATDSVTRRECALAAAALGEGAEGAKFCKEARAGTILPKALFLAKTEPAKDDPLLGELTTLARALQSSTNAEATQAYLSLVDAKHPYYPHVVRCILNDVGDPISGRYAWLDHPTYFDVLRKCLQDTTPTGKVFFRANSSLPEHLDDPKLSREKTDERVCDVAADRIAYNLYGCPEYNALLKDADEVRTQIAALLDRYRPHVRQQTMTEKEFTASYVSYVIQPKPLDRPATKADVTAGKALFELNGRGKVAAIPQGAWVVLKSDKGEQPDWGLIVQAETDGEGKAVYGVVFRHRLQRVNADAIGRFAEARTQRP